MEARVSVRGGSVKVTDDWLQRPDGNPGEVRVVVPGSEVVMSWREARVLAAALFEVAGSAEASEKK